ncbi:DNA-processing protein DprA [Brevibacterium salitolerans]|uniref:Smf/DprA SLOG domain-containing protein n=1 Tax=Brevibacterium salitolerans TaxID=1403566 RepID=A0ABN2X532_9MICO
MTTDAERVAAADVVRLAEPGDEVLAALVRSVGFEEARVLALSRAAADRRRAVEAVAEAGGGGSEERAGLRRRTLAALERWEVRGDSLDGARDLRVMARLGGRLVLPGEEEWPAVLDDLGAQAPMALWVRGPLCLAEALRGAVAVVGARAADSYGLTLTRRLCWDLAAAGRTLVSGGAYGVDAAVHRTALGAQGATVAFMAGGVDNLYPRGNAALLTEIAVRGALVSETAPGQTAMRHRFLLRNRLIAASSRATVVTAAGHRSGALNTAHRAAELLRPVGAVPGPVLSDQSAGCHRLLQEGAAVLVTSAEDVLALAGSLGEAIAQEEQAELRLTDEFGEAELRVFSALPGRRGVDVPTVAARAGLSLSQAMSALASLELRGRAGKSAHGWAKRTG